MTDAPDTPEPIRCGRRNPRNMAFTCQLDFGHDGDHEAFPGNPAGLTWTEAEAQW